MLVGIASVTLRNISQERNPAGGNANLDSSSGRKVIGESAHHLLVIFDEIGDIVGMNLLKVLLLAQHMAISSLVIFSSSILKRFAKYLRLSATNSS